MSISFETFLEWAQDHFGEDSVKVRNTKHGVEICAHSHFAYDKLGKIDTKYHLWMSPQGGKKKIEHGAYRCWLTDTMGTLVGLVSECDGIPYEEAEEILEASLSLRTLEMKVDEFFANQSPVKIEEAELVVEKPLIELPPFTKLIDDFPHYNHLARRARNYLARRKIPTENIYLCDKGDYFNRIIIPYFNEDGKIVWYNGRALSEKKGILRYMKPDESQAEIMYMTGWPKAGTKVYIMEGEFDAISLRLAGFVACACGGKYLASEQIDVFRKFGWIPVLAFDTDPSGLEALIECGKELLASGFHNIRYVRPPAVYKDWNKLLEQKDASIVKAYIEKFEKPLTEFDLDLLSSRLQ